MSSAELAALVELLNRAPMSSAERMWAQSLITRLAAGNEAQQATAKSEEADLL